MADFITPRHLAELATHIEQKQYEPVEIHLATNGFHGGVDAELTVEGEFIWETVKVVLR